jgi:integrase
MAERIVIKTPEDIKALPVTGERYRAWDEKVAGLCVRVGAGGAKQWFFEYRDPAGKRQCYKLGDATRLNPGDARKKIRGIGLDPAADKRAEKAKKVEEERKKAEAKAAEEQRQGRTLSAFLEGDYWDLYLSHKRSGQATKQRIATDWADLLHVPLDEIDATTVDRIRRGWLKDGIKPQTANRSYTALRALLNTAVDAKVIGANPIAKGGVKDLKVDDDKRVRWLGQRDDLEHIKDEHGKKVGERERFLAALDQAPRYLQILALIPYYAGLRRGEVFALTWGAVDFQREQITVLAHTAKGAKTRRVPTPIVLHGALLGWKKECERPQEKGGKRRRLKANDLVVPNPYTGAALTTIKRAWATLTEKAKLEDFHYHDLRHDYASRLVMRGVDLPVVRDLLGHSSIVLTERYAHLAPEHLRKAVEVL